MFFTITKKSYLTEEQLKTTALMKAYYIVQKYPLNTHEKMLDNYYKFMKLGSDKWPMEAFSVLGVDLESPEVYQNAINLSSSI